MVIVLPTLTIKDSAQVAAVEEDLHIWSVFFIHSRRDLPVLCGDSLKIIFDEEQICNGFVVGTEKPLSFCIDGHGPFAYNVRIWRGI